MHDPREEVFHEPKERFHGVSVRRSQRVLTVEDLAARRAEEEVGELASEISSATEVTPSVPADSEAALRHARLGFVAAAALVLLLVWVMQRRRGA